MEQTSSIKSEESAKHNRQTQLRSKAKGRDGIIGIQNQQEFMSIILSKYEV